MLSLRLRRFVPSLSLVIGCAGGAGNAPLAVPEAPSEPLTESAPSAEASDSEHEPTTAPGLPRDCDREGELCLPPRAFVKRLCQGEHLDAALALLAKSSPFTRGYVRARAVDSVNTRGGPASDSKLVFDEEVLIVERFGSAPGGMQVSGSSGYIVLRWDGTCATLEDSELTLRAPPAPRHAPFEFRYLDSSVQSALLADPEVQRARKKQREACRGVSMGMRTAACVRAEDELGERVALAVRSGIELPVPERLP